MKENKPCLCASGSEVSRVILFVNLHKKNTEKLAFEIKAELEKNKKEADIFSFEGKPELPPGIASYKKVKEDALPAMSPEGKWDLAFSLGGDGTVLYTARCLAHLGLPILPINLGLLGFLAEVNSDDWLSVFNMWEKGEITPSQRCMLTVSVERNGKIVMDNFCLNDAVVSCTGIAKLIKLKVQIAVDDNQSDSGTAVELGSYRCDGLIVATPTGSTAYSMAAGGPILDPEMDAVIINPICPFALSNRPYVVTSRQTIIVTVAERQKSEVLLTIDGQDTFNLQCDDKVIIKQSPHKARLIYPGKLAYYSALRKKLFWSGETV